MPQLRTIPVQWRIYWQDMSVVIPYALAWCYWMTLSLPPGAPQDCLKIKTARHVGPRTNLFCYALKPCYLALYKMELTAYIINTPTFCCVLFGWLYFQLLENVCDTFTQDAPFPDFFNLGKNVLCGTYLFKGINNDVFYICSVYKFKWREILCWSS